MDATYSLRDIIVVVVIYKMPLSASQTIKSLNEDLSYSKGNVDVIVYDNSPVSFFDDTVCSFKQLNIRYKHNPGNPGVSTAYNYAASIGISENKRFILLLDQDTSLPPMAMNSYLNAINEYPSNELFAPKLISNGRLFSPCRYFFKKGSHLNPEKVHVGKNRLEGITFLNSGLLISLETFQSIGGYDESIRLYFSDFDFVDRLRPLLGNYILVNVVCYHDLSSNEFKDKEKAAFRFGIYCRDGRYAAKHIISGWQHAVAIGLRAIKLAVYFSDMKFVGIYFRNFIFLNRNSK